MELKGSIGGSMPRTRWGTAYFVSYKTAIAYYRLQGESPYDVRRKVKEGLIHIGKPPLKPGDKLSVIPVEGRYMIEGD